MMPEMDVGAYLDLLQTYAQQPETDKLNACLKQETAYGYRVRVHGIKSASLSVGFSHLGEQALALENAAREEDWDFIRANRPPFIDEYSLPSAPSEKRLACDFQGYILI